MLARAAAVRNDHHLTIDANACPVKQEIYRVAERHVRKGAALKVFVVRNSPIAVPTASWPDLFRPSTSFSRLGL